MKGCKVQNQRDIRQYFENRTDRSSGKVDFREFVKALKDLGVKDSESNIRRLFSYIDKNKNRKLDPIEIKDFVAKNMSKRE